MEMKKVSKTTTNRKWHLTLLIVAIATIGLFVPPLVSVWIFNAKQPLTLLSGTEYVSLITLIVSAYFGANVMHRHVETRNMRTWRQNTWQQMEEATSIPGSSDIDVNLINNDESDENKEA